MSAAGASTIPMSVADFFDSNVLLYGASNQQAKAARAAALLLGGALSASRCSTNSRPWRCASSAGQCPMCANP